MYSKYHEPRKNIFSPGSTYVLQDATLCWSNLWRGRAAWPVATHINLRILIYTTWNLQVNQVREYCINQSMYRVDYQTMKNEKCNREQTRRAQPIRSPGTWVRSGYLHDYTLNTYGHILSCVKNWWCFLPVILQLAYVFLSHVQNNQESRDLHVLQVPN